MSSVVVVDDVTAIVRTRYGDRIRYRSSGISSIFETQYAVFSVCGVG